jgi:Recombination endonuclease VII
MDCGAAFTGTKRRCPDCQAKYLAAWYGGRKTQALAAARFKRYGITPEQYAEKFQSQDGRCVICGKEESQSNSVDGNLGVDHDHRCCSGRRSCGKCLRDLLCRRCNALLGLADDDAAVLQAALAYLQRWAAD